MIGSPQGYQRPATMKCFGGVLTCTHHAYDALRAQEIIIAFALRVYGAPMKTKSNSVRRRSIAWSAEADAEAIELARLRGYYPEKTHGGVSKMLADLVVAQSSQRTAEPPANITPITRTQPVKYGTKKPKKKSGN
jgi:hypothetical protein